MVIGNSLFDENRHGSARSGSMVEVASIAVKPPWRTKDFPLEMHESRARRETGATVPAFLDKMAP
jgi:hypothetical protein